MLEHNGSIAYFSITVDQALEAQARETIECVCSTSVFYFDVQQLGKPCKCRLWLGMDMSARERLIQAVIAELPGAEFGKVRSISSPVFAPSAMEKAYAA